MNPYARIIFPSLRWRASTGYRHERRKIDQTLALGVGGYIIFGGDVTEARKLTSELRSASPHSLLIGSDFERGGGQQLDGLTHLPAAAALGFLNDIKVTRRCGEITGREARSVGINWVYAPVADLDIEPDNPIVQTRSFGDDPDRVGGQVSAWIEGAKAGGVAPTVKHFPGHGRTTTDSHASLPEVLAPLDALEKADLRPFRHAVKAGVPSVMSAHVAYPAWDPSGLPATLSSTILGYLRQELGFNGVVVTDALIMEGARRGRGEAKASVDAIKAGCDALLYPLDAFRVAEALSLAARNSSAFKSRLNEASERITALAESIKAAPAVNVSPDDRAFADATADRAMHTLRGESLALQSPLSISIVDDDLGGPYAVGPRDIFAKQLRTEGIDVRPGGTGSNVLLVFSEPRSWKGHALLSPASKAAVDARAPRASLIILFGHPRLEAEIPGSAPVLCAWHGQPLMQEAAARWVHGRVR